MLKMRLLALLLAGACMAVTTAADAQIVVRGEMERLARQHYDYNYRNSNRNVFRRSNHFHPTKNVFRSSRYYRNRLAASTSGYPLRTTVRYGHRRGRRGGFHEDAYSFVYPRRSPYGPSPDGYLLGATECTTEPNQVLVVVGDNAVVGGEPNAPREPIGLTRDQIEMVPIRVQERKPTRRAVIRTETLADGRVRSIITSVPIEKRPDTPAADGLEEAWALLGKGDTRRAAEIFARHTLEAETGAAATLGYGIALAMQGDVSAATAALRRATELDAGVLQTTSLDDGMREVVANLVALSD